MEWMKVMRFGIPALRALTMTCVASGEVMFATEVPSVWWHDDFQTWSSNSSLCTAPDSHFTALFFAVQLFDRCLMSAHPEWMKVMRFGIPALRAPTMTRTAGGEPMFATEVPSTWQFSELIIENHIPMKKGMRREEWFRRTHEPLLFAEKCENVKQGATTKWTRYNL